MQLDTTTVLFDFDGTISERDVGVVLLEELGDPEWRVIEDLYARGELGSRETQTAQLQCLPADRDRLLAVARSVPLDPAFAPLAADLAAAGADVLVVSDGFGFHVTDALAGLGVPVLTNEVDWDRFEMAFPNEDRCCPCSTCGTCKQAPIRDAQRAGRTVVFVGDGVSDRKAALLADVVFAKDRLASWCDAYDVAYRRYSSLADVGRALLGAGWEPAAAPR